MKADANLASLTEQKNKLQEDEKEELKNKDSLIEKSRQMDDDNDEALATLKKHEEDLNNLRQKQAQLDKELKTIEAETKQKKMEVGRLESSVKDHTEH